MYVKTLKPRDHLPVKTGNVVGWQEIHIVRDCDGEQKFGFALQHGFFIKLFP